MIIEYLTYSPRASVILELNPLKLMAKMRDFHPSKRPFSEKLPSIEYRERDIVRKVGVMGKTEFKNYKFFISQALKGEYIALRETPYRILWCFLLNAFQLLILEIKIR